MNKLTANKWFSVILPFWWSDKIKYLQNELEFSNNCINSIFRNCTMTCSVHDTLFVLDHSVTHLFLSSLMIALDEESK